MLTSYCGRGSISIIDRTNIQFNVTNFFVIGISSLIQEMPCSLEEKNK